MIIAIAIGWIFSVQKDPRPMLQPLLAQRITILSRQPRFSRSRQPEPNLKESMLLQSGTFLLGTGKGPVRLDEKSAATLTLTSNQSSVTMGRLKLFLENVTQELRELGGMLILGSAIAACLQVFVPREIVLSLGQGSISSILAMMLLAAIVSICSTVDAFFALSFASTFTTSSLLAFLVFGPMIDIKAVGLMLSIFQPRMIVYLFALAAQLTFILALFHSYFL